MMAPARAEIGQTEMPAYFSLTLKGESEPMPLAKVDDLICEKLGVAADPDKYYANWYDVIGLLLALGKGELGSTSLRQAVLDFYSDTLAPPEVLAPLREEKLQVLRVLEEYFTSNAWC
jgi:hypothetical protein